ncbi:VLRF1 family aeRF1-type release factor [Nonomuraea sp. NPDC049486]|uniref:MSMEG_1130 family ribosome hibernation factor n=1 Tax=Nonomuraea sp. NPDC049486 TaxID=3155773 RepID=UPI0034340EE2
MAAIEELDDKALLELSGRTDAAGVLSVYVNADPGGDRNAAAIDLKNRYRELRRRVAEEGPAERRREVVAALDRFGPEVEELAAPIESGRGRIAFAALGDDWVVRLDSQMPVPNRVVLDDGPFVHPLLELLDEGRPAGVVLVSSDDARLLEWRLGRLREVSRLEQEDLEAPHERAGQIGGGPAGQYNTPMREQRKARERAWAQRFLDRVAETVTNLTEERRWERILVSGGDQWAEILAGRLPEPLRDRVIRDTRVLAGLDDPGLLAAVTERLHAEHTASERRLLEQVLDAGLSKKGALGLSQVAGALNEGRVAHLVYDPEVRYVGSVDADGTLYADTETGVRRHTPEPRLNERLVERALATGARVSPIEGAGAGVLGDAGGIGALLRW